MNTKTTFVRGLVVLALAATTFHIAGCADVQQMLAYDDCRARSHEITVVNSTDLRADGYVSMGGYGRYAPDAWRDHGAMNRAVPRVQRNYRNW